VNDFNFAAGAIAYFLIASGDKFAGQTHLKLIKLNGQKSSSCIKRKNKLFR
jgi:hypothetical protein